MIYVPNDQHDPRLNLAIETYLLKEVNITEPLLFFYINQPSIIIGRNQNTLEEINKEYVDRHNILVVRRLSGGGAVYHDYGNLNFSFIMPDDGNSFRDFKRFTQPVLEALHQLGAKGATLSGRNDLLIEGMKFSGNAMYATNGRMFAHGTILFDSNIDEVVHALKARQDKMESKGIKSIRSRVTNLKPYLNAQYHHFKTEDFKEKLLEELIKGQKEQQLKTYELTKQDWEKVEQIADRYYRNWDWNYGKSPAFTLKKRQRFSFGTIEVRLNIVKGKIDTFTVYGDFFGLGDVKEIEKQFVGIRYEKEALKQTIESIDLKKYFGNLSKKEFLTFLYSLS